jgi:hypothetical protein
LRGTICSYWRKKIANFSLCRRHGLGTDRAMEA